VREKAPTKQKFYSNFITTQPNMTIDNSITITSTTNQNQEEPSTKPVVDMELADDNAAPTTSSQDQQEDSEAELSPEELLQRKRNCYKKGAIAVILVALVAFVIADSLTNKWIIDGINSFLEWIENNPAAGFFVFVLVYFAATIIFIPGSILTLGAGFVFSSAFGLGPGVALGTLSVFLGASAGATVSFLLGRFLLRDWVIGLTKKYAIFEALDVAFEEKGFRIMVLLRLSPIIPFNAINYIAGVTAISFWSYVWALFAILPGTILYVLLGASAGSLTDSASSGDNGTLTIVVVVVGIVFGIIAVGLTSYYAKSELNKVVAKRQQEMENATREAVDDNDVELQATEAVDDNDVELQATKAVADNDVELQATTSE
jgi:uncharacterized membrane protein YdjX (TVP38/TMEM64 family)